MPYWKKMSSNPFWISYLKYFVIFDPNVCYEKFDTHLLLYTVANVCQIFRNRRYKELAYKNEDPKVGLGLFSPLRLLCIALQHSDGDGNESLTLGQL